MTSASIVAQLLWLESDSPDKPITMYINSPGGEITSGTLSRPAGLSTQPTLFTIAHRPFLGLAIYDTMSYIRSPVSTICVGGAASMAALLLTGGEAGKRYALPHSSIMVHQPLGGTRGQASDILIYATQIQRIKDQVNRIYKLHLNKAAGYDRYGLAEIEEMMERDKYMSAEEARECGIIDEILDQRAKGDPKPAEAEAGAATF